jgi:hypothetical protein
MKKMLFVFLVMLILTACTAVESPPTQTKVPPADTKAPPTVTPIPPTPDLTADWPEYINTDLGYSFKYPAGCFLGPMGSHCKQNPPEERPPECLCFLNPEDPYGVFMQSFLGDPAEGFIMVSFYVMHLDTEAFNPPEGEDWVKWVKEKWSYLSEDMPDEANLTFGGLPAVRIYTPGGGGGSSADNIFVEKDGKLILISMINVEIEEQREFYELILATFQFSE